VELIGLFLIAAALLVCAGIAKALRPADTARALPELLPRRATPALTFSRSVALVRAGATLEALVGIAALLMPGPVTAALVALSYATFGGVVLLARRRSGVLATCGCFGRPDTPPTLVHLVLNLVFAASATAVACSTPFAGTLVNRLAGQPWSGAPLLFVCAVGTWLSALAMSSLGALEGSRRLLRART
jgi:Methylamine utilisation protein MauE